MTYEKEIARLESEIEVLQKRLSEYVATLDNIKMEILRLEGEHRFCVRRLKSKDEEKGNDTETSKPKGKGGDTDT